MDSSKTQYTTAPPSRQPNSHTDPPTVISPQAHKRMKVYAIAVLNRRAVNDDAAKPDMTEEKAKVPITDVQDPLDTQVQLLVKNPSTDVLPEIREEILDFEEWGELKEGAEDSEASDDGEDWEMVEGDRADTKVKKWYRKVLG